MKKKKIMARLDTVLWGLQPRCFLPLLSTFFSLLMGLFSLYLSLFSLSYVNSTCSFFVFIFWTCMSYTIPFFFFVCVVVLLSHSFFFFLVPYDAWSAFMCLVFFFFEHFDGKVKHSSVRVFCEDFLFFFFYSVCEYIYIYIYIEKKRGKKKDCKNECTSFFFFLQWPCLCVQADKTGYMVILHVAAITTCVLLGVTSFVTNW